MKKYGLISLLILLVLSCCSSAAFGQTLPDQVLLCWTADSSTTQTISWRLPAGCQKAEVQYVLGDRDDFSVATTVPASPSALFAGYERWQATLIGLVPGTTYCYRVGNQGQWSEPGRFKTASKSGFTFIYLGDSQQDPDAANNNGYQQWGALLDLAVADASHPSFLLLGGDLVNDGSDPEEWGQLWAAGATTLANLPVMATPGNHDTGTIFKNYLLHPLNGPQDNVYSFDYGQAHFLVLDSNDIGYADWVADDLAATKQKYKIVLFHTPAYPALAIPKDQVKAAAICQTWVPLFNKYGVDLVLNGHQHVYARTYPQAGTTYLMGVSGGKHYTADQFPYLAKFVDNKAVYTLITVNDQGLSLISKDRFGAVVDQASLGQNRSFPDISDSEGKAAVTAMSASGYVRGCADGKFWGQVPLSRAEAATILVRLLALPQLQNVALPKDVSGTSWYAYAVVTAVRAGILTVDQNGSVNPEQAVSGAELAVMLQRAAQVLEDDQASTAVSNLTGSFQWAENAGLLDGSPNEMLNRAEGVTAFYKWAVMMKLL